MFFFLIAHLDTPWLVSDECEKWDIFYKLKVW